MYPFDTLNFKYRFETSHFELKNESGKTESVIRFDFWPTIVNPVSWKEEVDELPEFDIDFGTSILNEAGYDYKHYFEVIQENKPLKETKENCFYYPGFIFSFNLIRDPSPKILKCSFQQ